MIVNAITSFLGMIVEQIMKPLRELLADTLLATPDVTRHADLKRLWAGSMGITAGIYVLFVTAGGITVMGYETVQTRYALKQIAPRLLIGIIASATSLIMMGKAIALGNALSHAIMGIDMADAGQGLVERALPFSLFGAPGLKIYLLIVSIVMIVLILAVLIGYVVRVAVMALLAVSGPLSLACHAHPLTDPMARLWWRGLAGCLVIQVAQSMTFIVALRLFFAPGATALGIPYSDQLGTMLAGLALFWVLFKIPGWTMQVVFRSTPIHNPHAPTAVRLLRTLAVYRLMDRYLPGTSLLRRGPGGGGRPGGGGGHPGRGGGRPPRPGPQPGSPLGRRWLGTGSAAAASRAPGSGPAATGSPTSGSPSGPAGTGAARAGAPVAGSAAAPTLPRGPAGRLSTGSRVASPGTSQRKGPHAVVHPAQARRKRQLTLPVTAQRVSSRTPRPVQTWLRIRAERVPRPHTTTSSLASPSSPRPPLGRPGPRMASRQNAIALVGKITEKLLKQLWRHHEVAGDPSGRMLSELIKGCRPHIRSTTVLDALTDIQRLRNRSTHDGYEIAEEDGLLAVRRLVDVLAWFTSTASPALTGNDPRMQPEVARRVEFLAGLYLTLGYRVSKRFVLSTETVYQLFCRESGVRLEYVELLLSKDAAELRNVLETTGGELLKTRLPKLTRFVILDDAVEQLHPLLGHDYRIVGYEGFIDTVVDLQTHLASCATAAPEMPRERQPLPGALLTTDPHTGESRITETEDAEQLLTRLMQESANVLITGKPGSGKSTLLRALVNDTPATARRFRFYFDLSLKPKDEAFAEYVARMLAPCVPGERARAFDLFLYLIRSGSALCVLDAVDEAVDEPSPEGFLRLFADLASVLSAESCVVLNSRVSFLADSPQIRRLLDCSSAISEQLVEQMYANGVDPQRVPRFSMLRLTDTPADRELASDTGAAVLPTPLARRLQNALDIAGAPTVAELIGTHIDHALADAGLAHLAPALVDTCGRAFLEDRTVFPLLELHNALGPQAFDGGRITPEDFCPNPLFRPAGPQALAFIHSAYQELLAARYLSTPDAREQAAELPGAPYLTEQVRAFLAAHPTANAHPAPAEDCVLHPGVYLVGPAERLLLRRVHYPIRFDRYPVTRRPLPPLPPGPAPRRNLTVGPPRPAARHHPRPLDRAAACPGLLRRPPL
ncbi:NACHT domain-containing protein [Streptomyces asiaticus]